MTAISLLSTFAVIVGLAGILPQLSRMLRSRSAAGQSAFGWSLGAAGNLSMLYVNLVGYHATILAVNNLIALMLCVVAMSIILWLNRHEEAEGTGAPEDLTALPTQEFEALVTAVRSAAAHRESAVAV
jgi:uncharacterized protein with PQ loop repeat